MLMDRMACLLVAVLMFWPALSCHKRAVSSRAIIEVARQLDDRKTFEPASLEWVSEKAEERAAEWGCASDPATATIRVHLALLDEAMRIADFDAMDRERSKSIALVRHQLSCSPANGLAWFQLARLGNATAGFSPAVLRHISLSQRMAPAESAAVWFRLPLVSDLATRKISGLAVIQEKDLETVAKGADPREIGAYFDRLSETAQLALLDGINRFGDDRLQRAAGRLKLSGTAPDRR